MILRATLLVLLLSTAACSVHRELVIETDPPGARVFMDREAIGLTPIHMPYEYGGVREFLILHEEGETKYAPTRVVQDSSSFFYDQFPFDVLARLLPFRSDETITLSIELEPSRLAEAVMDDEDNYVRALMERAEEMRQRARRLQNEGEPAAPPFLPPIEDGNEKDGQVGADGN